MSTPEQEGWPQARKSQPASTCGCVFSFSAIFLIVAVMGSMQDRQH